MVDILPKSSRDVAYDNIFNLNVNSYLDIYKSSLFVFAGINQWFDDSEKGIPCNPNFSIRMEYPKYLGDGIQINPIFKLNNLNENDLAELFSRICLVYKNVYRKSIFSKIKNYASDLIKIRFNDFISEGEFLSKNFYSISINF